ncbi:MAG TPA: MATE family efflux transporter [Candidatus Latescibacteria bacterium]|nr:MATE family efflux transporter [Candidatus Latescibacterota bacterium]HJP34070.1 MATE family efflux transporter [Candidatus Latescibacterota bacterium]
MSAKEPEAPANPIAAMLGGGGKSRVAEFVADPRRAVWKLSVPVMAGMAIQTLYNIVDMIFVGRLGGDAVAALTFNMPIGFFAMGVAFGLGTGATSVIARFIGADDKKSADNAAEHALLVALGFGVLAVVGALWFKVQIFAMLGAEGEVLRLATQYFEVVVLSFLFQILNVTFRSIMGGEGDTRTPLALQGTGTLLNIVLDPIFIFWLDMGVRGAALATVASQIVVFIAFILYIFVRKGTYVEFRFADFKPSARITADILNVGLPASASMVIMSVGGMFYNRIVSAFGAQAVAGLGIGGRMDAVFFLPIFALATSQVTLAGMFVGARRPDLIRETVIYTILRAEIFAVALGVLFWIFAPQLSGWFTEDPVIIGIAAEYVRVISCAFPFITIGIISGRVFQGLGSGMPGLLLTALRIVLISVPLAWILTQVFDYGLRAVWISFAVSGFFTSIVAVAWVHLRLRRVEADLQGRGPAGS